MVGAVEGGEEAAALAGEEADAGVFDAGGEAGGGVDVGCAFEFEVGVAVKEAFDVEGGEGYKIVFVVFVEVQDGVAYLLHAEGCGKGGFGCCVTLELIVKSTAGS